MSEQLPQPRAAVGALVVHKGQVLLVKRGKAPARGVWALPGGRVQWGETLAAAAEREVLEETGIAVRAERIIYTFDNIVRDAAGVVRFHYIIVDFLAHPLTPDVPPTPGDDADDARWFFPHDLAGLPVSGPTRQLIQRMVQEDGT
ncbi:MAG: NUDIX domain-containing protein [Caldilineae bacterium]|nr:MAG: NUDIX domain-containing protein [Caldilineae bacterium]